MIQAFDEKVIPAAREGFAVAQAGLEDAQRLAAYEAAIAQRKAAADRLKKDYPDLAKAYAQLLATVQDADAAIEAANGNLPHGRDPLDTVEATVRDHPAVPRRIISDEVKSIWHHASGEIVNDPSRIKGGIYRHPHSDTVHFMGTDHCRAIPRRVVVSVPFRPGLAGPRLTKDALPPLRPEAPADRAPVTEYLSAESASAKGAA
jgi:hypothetical protein